MIFRLSHVLGAFILVLGCAGGVAWWLQTKPEPKEIEVPAGDVPGGNLSAGTQATGDDLPLPPLPPRIADSDQYDKCMTMLAEDPEGAEAIATSMQAAGGGDGAIHCQALAMIANGDAEGGATMLENLAHAGKAAGFTRAVLLSQAAEARLIADQAQPALKDASEALEGSQDDPDLLIGRANAFDALDRGGEAMDDLNRALALDAARSDALVLRASISRRMDKLDDARSDVDKAIAMNPGDAEALLERGILLEQMGDVAGARRDWTHAREVDPNSEAAELAAQNLTLLDAGPEKK